VDEGEVLALAELALAACWITRARGCPAQAAVPENALLWPPEVLAPVVELEPLVALRSRPRMSVLRSVWFWVGVGVRPVLSVAVGETPRFEGAFVELEELEDEVDCPPDRYSKSETIFPSNWVCDWDP
jgi:hypothetical protein